MVFLSYEDRKEALWNCILLTSCYLKHLHILINDDTGNELNDYTPLSNETAFLWHPFISARPNISCRSCTPRR